MKYRQRLLLVTLLLLSACDTSEPGTLFNVTAELTDTTCGTGVVDAKDSSTFQIRLALDDTTLTWYDVDKAESREGSLSDEVFSVSASSNYAITEATGASVGCTVRRHDKYSGDAALDEDGAIKQLEGTLVFDYSEATGFDCDALIGDADGFEDLPCEIEYSFVAKPD